MPGGEGETGEDVHCFVFQLRLHDGHLLHLLEHIVAQKAGISHGAGEHGGCCVGIGTENANHLQGDTGVFGVVEVFQAGLGLAQIGIAARGRIMLKAGGREEHLVGFAAKLLIAPGGGIVGGNFLLVEGGAGDFGHLGLLFKAQGVEHQIGQLIVFVDNQHHLVVGLRPLTVNEIILLFDEVADDLPIFSGEDLLPDIHGAEAGHAVHISRGKAGGALTIEAFHGGVDELHHIRADDSAGGILGVDIHVEVIAILQGAHMGHDGAILALKVVAKTVEIVGFRAGAGHGVHHVVHDGVGIDAIFLLGLLLLAVGHHGRHQCGHIHCLSLELDGVGGKGVFLYLVDVGLNASGEGENEGDADDADGAGQSGENGSPLFGE